MGQLVFMQHIVTQPMVLQSINVWPFINGAYGVAILFLVGFSWLTYQRYHRARARLAQVERLL